MYVTPSHGAAFTWQVLQGGGVTREVRADTPLLHERVAHSLHAQHAALRKRV